MSEVEAKKQKEKNVEEGGELLFCGSTSWGMTGRKKGRNYVSPTRLLPLLGVKIRFVASGCASCHCVALDVEGRCYTWGHNEKGQLGHGDTVQRDSPTIVSELSKYKIVQASAGKSHTVVVTEMDNSLAFGWNKHGQLGSGSTETEIEASPVRCLVSKVKSTACGGDFTVWLTSAEGESILTAGLPQYGQLGHGTDHWYNAKEYSVEFAYEAQPCPKAIASLAGETIVKVACGTNHTVAVDSNGYVYTWGCGIYGRLGHGRQKDEFAPRRVDVFKNDKLLPPNAIISAGSMTSSCTAGNMHYFVGTDCSTISWGRAQYGELGYGPKYPKSSVIPCIVECLEDMRVLGVACGARHSMVIVDRTDVGDRLDQLDVYDGKASAEDAEAVSEAPVSSKKNGGKAADKTRRRNVVRGSGRRSGARLRCRWLRLRLLQL